MALLHREFNLSLTQLEVDFVVPDLRQDLPLCIDPFLLYRSNDPDLRALHSQLIGVFNHGIDLFRNGDTTELARLIDFPEVNEIGFGYTAGAIRGRGLGPKMNHVMRELLGDVGELLDRGIRHIEELQLLSVRIGPDLVSDTVANLLKSYLVEYTQQQSALHGIPVSASVPVNHAFDFQQFEWSDGYFDLPSNPYSGLPVLLVPRRIVRLLPWINYSDYQQNEFRAFLHPRRPGSGPKPPARTREPVARPAKRLDSTKPNVIRTTRRNLTLLDKYVDRKEREGANAAPALQPSRAEASEASSVAERLLHELAVIPPGRAAASRYQRLVLGILNFAFEPELTDGKVEERTHAGTERRDIIFTNESNESFWQYVREHHDAVFQMFECKNTADLEPGDLNQSATYLGVRLGTFGVLVTRRAPSQEVLLKSYSIHNDGPGDQRKILLILCDEDLAQLVEARRRGVSPAKLIQQRYREFRLRCQ